MKKEIYGALQACHTFDDLAYKNTTYVLSDPIIILNFDPYQTLKLILIISGAVSAIVGISVILIYSKKKKKKVISN